MRRRIVRDHVRSAGTVPVALVVVDEMQFAGAVELNDGTKRPRMSVEEVLSPRSSVDRHASHVITQFEDPAATAVFEGLLMFLVKNIRQLY